MQDRRPVFVVYIEYGSGRQIVLGIAKTPNDIVGQQVTRRSNAGGTSWSDEEGVMDVHRCSVPKPEDRQPSVASVGCTQWMGPLE